MSIEKKGFWQRRYDEKSRERERKLAKEIETEGILWHRKIHKVYEDGSTFDSETRFTFNQLLILCSRGFRYVMWIIGFLTGSGAAITALQQLGIIPKLFM